jgi:hypothetical protein
MKPMIRILFLALVAASTAACSSGPEKEWYRPGSSYTVADFQRDEKACTTNRVVDEECLKKRGWVPLSVEEKKPTNTAPTGPKGTRSY